MYNQLQIYISTTLTMSTKTFLTNFANNVKQNPSHWATFPSEFRVKIQRDMKESNKTSKEMQLLDRLEDCGLKVTIDRPHLCNCGSDDVDICAQPDMDIKKLENLISKL